MAEQNTSELGQAIQEVSERLSLLVREEIELAKVEMQVKATRLGRGIYLLHSLAWGIFAIFSDDPNYVWVGYLVVGGLLLVLGGLAGFLAARFIKSGTPPTPKMAIEEAQLIRETVQTSRPAQPIGAGGRVESSDPAERA
jgi:Putative Actinobacterial Holin-X, holin superfamily III